MDPETERWIEQTLERLSHSSFRARFELNDKDRAYARAKGRAVIDQHAHEMLRERVGSAQPRNDGRQTPWRGHPVFTAQHATATCCRGCIEKWHHIPKGRELSADEVDRLAALVMAWIERDLTRHPAYPGTAYPGPSYPQPTQPGPSPSGLSQPGPDQPEPQQSEPEQPKPEQLTLDI